MLAINHLAAWAYPLLLAVLPEWAAGSIAFVLAVLEGIVLLAVVAVAVAAVVALGTVVLGKVYDRFVA